MPLGDSKMPDAVVTAVSGCIHTCLQAGVPKDALIPIRPWDKPSKPPGPDGKTDAGKAPAFFNGGGWQNLGRWQQGYVDDRVLFQADELGANAGLVCGIPVSTDTDISGTPLTENGPLQYLGIDVDLNEPADQDEEAVLIKARNLIVGALIEQFGPKLLVRETRPYRALVLLTHMDIIAGRKAIFKLSVTKPNGETWQFGKIEILTHGQQFVIAGRHQMGYPIQWYRADQPNAPRLPAPPIRQGVVVKQNFMEIMTAFNEVVEKLQRTHKLTISTDAPATTADTLPVPAEQLAPSNLVPAALVAVIDAMMNVSEVGYGPYCELLIAIDGAVKGIAAHNGPIPQQYEQAIEDAVVGWMCRWDHAHCPTPDAARAKWQNDYHRPDKERRSGWAKLTRMFRELVRRDAATDFDTSPQAEDRRRVHNAAVQRAERIIRQYPLDYLPPREDASTDEAEKIFDKAAQDGPRQTTVRDFPGLINLREWEGKEIPKRRWIVEDWLPVGHVTLLYGDGGIGKSLLTQELLTCCAAGLPWLGMPVEQMTVFGIFCEDTTEELMARQDAINRHLGISFSDIADRLHLVSWYAKDTEFIHFDREGKWTAHKRMTDTYQLAKDLGARLVSLDVASDFFDGDENSRRQPRVFIRALIAMANKLDGAVLLSAHPSKAAMVSGRHDSGSTSWNGTVRSRWALLYTDKEKDPNGRILSREKGNYAAPGGKIMLRWQRGLLLTEEESDFPTSNRKPAEDVFLELLDICAEQGVRVSNSKNARNYAPKEFAGMEGNCYYDKRELEAAMMNLFARKAIRMAKYTKNRNEYECIVRQENVDEPA